MSVEMLSGIAAVVLSLIFSYVPGSESKWAQLEGVYKRLWMLAGLLAITLAVFALACSGFAGQFGLEATCDQAGLIELVKVFGLAAMANQTAYALTPKK